jgi:hypothetical protein
MCCNTALLSVFAAEICANVLQSEQAEEEEPDEGGDEDGSDGPITNPAPTDPQAIAQARAAALEPNDAPWKRGQPKAQPLTYTVPTDVNGGKAYRTIKFTVDFTDGDSVERANKCRRQGLYRAGKNLGLPLKRPPTHDKQYTQVNNNWIMAQYDSYAAAHNNCRITYKQLAHEYNKRFTNERRSEQSLASHIHRTGYLKNKKDSYIRQP